MVLQMKCLIEMTIFLITGANLAGQSISLQKYIRFKCEYLLQVETFQPEGSAALQYKDLYDGVFLNDVLQQM